MFGSVTASEPSFGVLAASTFGYVWPPSVESAIFTFAVLTGATSVPATSHVTVCVEPRRPASPPCSATVTQERARVGREQQRRVGAVDAAACRHAR